MLDINFIKKHPEKVKKAITNKGISQIEPAQVDQLLKLHEQLLPLQQEIEKLRQERNENSDQVKEKAADKEFRQSAEFQKLANQGKELKKQIAEKESSYRALEEEFNDIMQFIPGVPSDDTPIGTNEDDNVEIRTWGEKPDFDFTPKDHVELGTKLGILDLERGTKVSGYRGYFLKNEGLLLHWAALTYAMQSLAKKSDFEPLLAPTLVRDFALFGSGHFPWGKPEVYQLMNPGKDQTGEELKDPYYLVGTAEVPVMAYHADETFTPEELPKKYLGFSPCYRSEVGGYHRDVKGIYRMHEFMKMEQVVLCEPDMDQAEALHQEITANAEAVLQGLNIPYRVIQMCTGDMGEPQYKKFDIESWMPGRGSYGETHSSSNMKDFQTRRLNIRVKKPEGGTEYAYSLNNTLLASPRFLIAILENNQQKDGSVKVPEPLQAIVGKEVLEPKD